MSTDFDIFSEAADAPESKSTSQIKKSEIPAQVPVAPKVAKVTEKAKTTTTRDFAAEYDSQIGNIKLSTNAIYPEIKPLPGFEQRWAAMYSTKGEYDGANMQRKKTRGFVIRPLESIEDYDWRADERNVSGEFGGLTVNNMVLMHRKITVGDQVRKLQMEASAKRGYEELNSARKKGGLHLDVESENNARVAGRKVSPADDE